MKIGAAIILATYFFLPSISSAQEVDLIWQGETYTSPFYEGLPLWTNESRITFSAIPNLPNVSPSSLYYRWSKNGVVLGSLSGVNKRSITFTDTVLSLPIEVKVDIRDGEEGEILGTNTIKIKPVAPKLIVVEDNPLYGLMFHNAVKESYTLSGEEINLIALPLFARVSYRLAPALTYTWTTNTGEVSRGNKVTYRAPEDTSGSSSIRLRLQNDSVLAQAPIKNFLVQFANEQEF